MEINKIFFACALIIGFLLVINIKNGANAHSWEYINGEWYYIDDTNGTAFCNCFVDRDGKKFFLGENGKIVRNSFFEWNDNYYYAGANGELAQNEFKFIEYDVAMRIGYESGKYYFGSDCKCYRRKGSTFKKKILGQDYVFDENGLVLTGWLDAEGSMINYDESSLLDGMYYADLNGVLYVNRWLDFNTDLGTYNMGDDTTLLGNTEYDYLDHMWMYFDENGKKVKSESDTDGKKRKINGQEFIFDENGVMITYFTKAGGLDYTQASNPTAKKNVKIYDGNEGDLVKGKWLWLYPSKELDEVEYNDQEYHWWYVDNDGRLVANKIKEIDGKKYVFDGIGRLKAGFVLFDGGRNYVANYLPEDLESYDFIYTVPEGSKLQGQELSDIRYFGEDDKLDGSMKTGEVSVELSDGTFVFSFADGGVAYGSRHRLKKINNTYYINGLKLTTKDDRKYGILKVDNYYKLIGANGKLKKGSKKVIKDEDDNYILMMGNDVVGYKRTSDLPSGDVVIKWRGGKDGEPAGFYYYHKDADSGVDKYHYGICLNPNTTTSLSNDDLDNIPEDMRVNFK